MFIIEKARPEDIPEIMDVIRLAFRREAVRVNDWNLPAFKETAEELVARLPAITLLVAREAGRIVGTGRATSDGDTVHIGRLAVHPDCQRRGIASALVRALADAHPAARRFEIFTSEKSPDNIALYAKLGYVEFKRVPGGHSAMVFMEKPSRAVRVSRADTAG